MTLSRPPNFRERRLCCKVAVAATLPFSINQAIAAIK